MAIFAIMALVSFETEVYVEADNLPMAMDKLARGGNDLRWDDDFLEIKYTPLDFIKPQVWDDEAGDFVPCNVIMFPVKEEITDEMEFEADV